MKAELTLHGYWRSSASYRVRIGLHLKGLAFAYQSVHLVKDGGQQHQAAYRSLNPSALVPTLEDHRNELVLTQSLAILEYLDEAYPDTPRLLPSSPVERCNARALAYEVAQDIQPITNLRVLQKIAADFAADDGKKADWQRHWMGIGFAALETKLAQHAGRFCFADKVTLADLCLVPQVYNARRFGLDMSAYPLISAIDERCNRLDPFIRALPENQPDAS